MYSRNPPPDVTSHFVDPSLAAAAVICATGFGYMRDDGIGVIPIAALAP